MRFLFCALLCFVGCAYAQNPAVRYSLKVLVKDSVSNIALEDASVGINKHNDDHITNKEGRVVFDTLRAGVYHVHVSYIGYHSFEAIVDVPSQRELVVLLCPSSYHIHEVMVEGNKSEGNNTYSLQARTILSVQQIEKNRGQNLGELLSNVNGLTTLNTGPGISKPVLRGMHSNRLVMLNNGIKQEEQQWGGEHAPAIDPFAVNSVEVIKGAASVEYGPEAIGGAIRLLPEAYPSENGMDGNVNIQGFSNNKQYALGAKLQGTHFNKLNWRAQGNLRKAGDSRAPDYVISNTGFETQSGSISAAYTLGKLNIEGMMSVFNTRIGIMRAAHVGSSTDLEKAIASDTPLIIKPFTYEIGKPYQQVWHETQMVRLKYPLLWGKLQYQFGRQLNSRQEYDLGVSWNPQSVSHTKPAYDLTLTTYTSDVLFEHTQWKNITGKIGLSMMNQSNYTGGSQKPIIPNFIANTYGMFVFEKWNKGRWAAEAGTRVDKRYQTIYVRNAANEIVTQERIYQSASGVVGGSYALTEKWKLASTFSTAWRPPSINELYSNGLHNGTATYEIGDSNLLSERSYNLDVSIGYRNHRWSFDGSLYANSIGNFIYLRPVQPPTITLRGTFPTFVFAQTDAMLLGGEVNVSRQLGKYFVASMAVSYLHANDVTHQQPLIYMPSNRSKLGLQYQTNSLWKVEHFYAQIDWQYVATQNRYVASLDYKEPPSAYNLINLSCGFEIPFYKQHIKITASVKNLLNTSYRDYLNRFRYFTDEPGRNIVVGVLVPFQLLTKK